MYITTTQRLNPERDEALRKREIKHNESYDKFPLLLSDQPERSKREDQKMCKCRDPLYCFYEDDYFCASGCGALNTMET